MVGGPSAKKLAPGCGGAEAVEGFVVRGVELSQEWLYTRRVMH